MSEKKELKRAVKAVWGRVKDLRSERAKLYAADDIVASADALIQAGEDLKDLAKELGALSAMPPSPGDPPAT